MPSRHFHTLDEVSTRDGSDDYADSPDPHLSFEPCSSATGLDFGLQFVKHGYRVVKHVDEHRRLITYVQSSCTSQTFSHAVTSALSVVNRGLVQHRAKHAIFFFDTEEAQILAHDWPSRIYQSKIASYLQNLGASFEFTRVKVRKAQFSLYIFGVKNAAGPSRFSTEGRRTWSPLCEWAYGLPDDMDNTTLSFELSSQGPPSFNPN